MAPKSLIMLCTLLILSLSFSLSRVSAMEYLVENLQTNATGTCFRDEIGVPYAQQVMGTITNFIWSTVFQELDAADQKPLDNVTVYIVDRLDSAGVAWGNNHINISAIVLEEAGDRRWCFAALMYHEMTHVFQWDGEGTAPSGLLEGIADYTTFTANYTLPDSFAKPGQGDRWDQGYEVTCRFLEYCDGIVPNFVAKLNKMMRFHYDVKYFQDLTGKPVEQLWTEYKAKYANNCPN